MYATGNERINEQIQIMEMKTRITALALFCLLAGTSMAQTEEEKDKPSRSTATYLLFIDI